MKNQIAFIAALLCFMTISFAHDQLPGEPQSKPMVLAHALIHTVSGEDIEDGMLLFDQGRIVEIGRSVSIPAGADVLDCTGKHVYPGLFEAYSILGLEEIEQFRSSSDQHEIGNVNSNLHAERAFNIESELIPVARANGVLISLIAPQGGYISGQAAIMKLDGWTWERALLKPSAAMHANMPARHVKLSPHSHGTLDDLRAQSEAEWREFLEIFKNARDYDRARAGDALTDARWEAMRPVLRGDVPLLITANDLADILACVDLAVREDVHVIIYGGYDAPLCSDLLIQRKIPVVVGGVFNKPRSADDPYDAAMTVPLRLHEAGVKWCLGHSLDSGASPSNSRNLPYQAAYAAAYGLPREVALKAITLYPAQIFAVDQEIGSLDRGKSATLFVADGDIMEIPTHVERAWIDGAEVDLSSRHTMLYEKYQEKYDRLEGK